MESMPRPRPPGLTREISRHGAVYWYVRRLGPDGKRYRVRIHGEYGSVEFMARYNAAVEGRAPPDIHTPVPRSLEWLIELYRKSETWLAYSHGTKRQREPILRQIITTAGTKPADAITRGVIIGGRDRRATTPAQARHFLETVRGLFGWATDAQLVTSDPTAGVRNPKSKKTGGFHTWTEAEVERYEARWRPGTRQWLWLQVLLYSGLRRGDAVRLGRQHVRQIDAGNGRMVRCHVIKIQKAGYLIEVTLPLLADLQAALERGPTGDLAYIAGKRGAPLTKESFGNVFGRACRAAGVPGRAHGLRKLGATRAANNGATDRELQALFGWTDYKMPSHYTRAADRRRLGVSAGLKLAGPDAGNKIAQSYGQTEDMVWPAKAKE